jgi:hypothetical protein
VPQAPRAGRSFRPRIRKPKMLMLIRRRSRNFPHPMQEIAAIDF